MLYIDEKAHTLVIVVIKYCSKGVI